jgi:hypothetical protein
LPSESKHKGQYSIKGATTGRIQTAKPNYIEGPRSENVVIIDYMNLLNRGPDLSKATIHEFLEEVKQAYDKLPKEEQERISQMLQNQRIYTELREV